MTLSILDIVVFSIGGIIVIIYSIFSIKKIIKYRKKYKDLLAKGYVKQAARQMAYNETYKKKNKKEDNDIICDD